MICPFIRLCHSSIFNFFNFAMPHLKANKDKFLSLYWSVMPKYRDGFEPLGIDGESSDSDMKL